jgi:hypothetical protein
MKFSPTNLLSYVRVLFALALLGHIVFSVFTQGIYFLNVQASVAYLAIWALGDKLLGGVESHFTADSPPNPKDN